MIARRRLDLGLAISMINERNDGQLLIDNDVREEAHYLPNRAISCFLSL